MYSTKILFKEIRKDDCAETRKRKKTFYKIATPEEEQKKDMDKIPESVLNYKDVAEPEDKSPEDEKKTIIKEASEKKGYNINGFYRDYMKDYRRTRLKRFMNETAIKDCLLNKSIHLHLLS